MDPLKMYELYCLFHRENKNNIEQKLKSEFATFYEEYRTHTKWIADFGGMVGVPLFILAVLWMLSTKTVNHWLIAAGMIAFGFWLRYYQFHTIKLACERFFRGRKDDIIADYVDAQMHAVMENQPKEQHDQTHELYRYFYRELVSENFRLWK